MVTPVTSIYHIFVPFCPGQKHSIDNQNFLMTNILQGKKRYAKPMVTESYVGVKHGILAGSLTDTELKNNVTVEPSSPGFDDGFQEVSFD